MTREKDENRYSLWYLYKMLNKLKLNNRTWTNGEVSKYLGRIKGD